MSAVLSNSMKLRRAAILVASLDTSTADAILGQMSDEQAAQVRRMMVELGDVDAKEQQQVIDEFCRQGSGRRQEPARVAAENPADNAADGGVELDAGLARRLEQGSEAEAAGHDSDDEQAPFRFLRDAHSARLTPFLAGEHPQTIALVASHLPPQRAAGLLAALAGPLQAEVLRRLTDLEQADPEILREVERGLESKIIESARSERRRAAGLNAVTGILQAADPAVKRTILSNLARHDRQLAGKLRPQRFEFADLERLDEAALAKVFGQAESELIYLALAGAAPSLMDRLLGQLSPAEARQFTRSIESLGPMRLSDVEEAQQRIAELARQLALEGEIELPGPAPTSSTRQALHAYRH